jgi:FdhD protein
MALASEKGIVPAAGGDNRSFADGGAGTAPGGAVSRRNLTPAQVVSVVEGHARTRSDRLVGEEPMEIRAAGPGERPVSVAVTMRTPGNDFELSAGFLFTEGLVAPGDIKSVSYCDDLDEVQAFNVVTVRLRRHFDGDLLKRNFYATSSCGVCGKASLEQVEMVCDPLGPGPGVDSRTIVALPDRLRKAQRIFEATGGLHAAGLFDAAGELLGAREDVGRHNAVDKLIGRAVLADDVPLNDAVLVVSGRVSFEIVQKAAVAGIPILVAVSAPSNLAVETAKRAGMTVAGFVRNGSCNIYSHPERISVG